MRKKKEVHVPPTEREQLIEDICAEIGAQFTHMSKKEAANLSGYLRGLGDVQAIRLAYSNGNANRWFGDQRTKRV
jgi:hypothetical protein